MSWSWTTPHTFVRSYRLDASVGRALLLPVAMLEMKASGSVHRKKRVRSTSESEGA